MSTHFNILLIVTFCTKMPWTPHEKALPDEAASVAALGMTYVHIPVEFDRPSNEDFDRFCVVMRELRNTPIHVHCIVNARVTAFIYRYRRDVLGVSDEDARAAMDSVWQPGGVWATFIGDNEAVDMPHRPAKAKR